ncbi:MAG: flagellar basal body protein, partial [Oscillospiraceae bacterium]|nr:flagellar basal body protein [Oscillospiraceae bacterium]
YVQRDALNIAQKSLDIVGNNISNIKTTGYTRQRVDVCSVGYAKGSLCYKNSIELSGRGAEAVGVAQLRDKRLDQHVRTYSAALCNSGVKMDALSKVEDIFDSIEADTRDTDGKDLGVSFASIVSKLKSALQSYSVDDADRNVMASTTLNAAKSLVECINKYANDIDKVSNVVISDTTDTVDRINQIFEEMGSINKEIKDAYVAMGYITSSMDNYQVQNQYGPLELKDKMHLLLDELSQYGNVDVVEENDGTFTVKFADSIVVKNKYYAQMAMTEVNPRPTELGFVLSSNDMHFKPKTDAAGNVIDAYGYVDTDVDYRIRGLKDKDEWYKLNLSVGTGGNAQVLLRSEDYKGELLNITGGHDGRAVPQYLESGALRGLLDVYNGRGKLFADAAGKYENVTKQVEVANKALQDLAAYNLDPDSFSHGEVEKLKDTIENAIGADITKVTETAADGSEIEKYVVKLNNVELLAADGTVQQLEVNTEPTQDFATVTVQGTGKLVRQIYTNQSQGIEYYRDLLNSFVKTMTDEFNGAYSGFDVKVDTAEYVNSYAMQLDEYNRNPQASDLTKQDVQDIIDKLQKVDGVTVSGNDGEYVVEYTDANNKTYTIVNGANTGNTLNKLDKDDLPVDNQTSIIKDVNYELFTYDKDSFRTAALDMRVGEEWLKRPEIISDPTNDNDYEELQNKQINKLLGVFGTQLTIFDDYGHKLETKHTPEDFVDYICIELGQQVSLEQTVYEVTDIALTLYENERSDVMDVSMEEEGVDMLNYQKWYSAISRMVSTMDELLDKLINNTGIVGLR